jgi:hypothetical protein
LELFFSAPRLSYRTRRSGLTWWSGNLRFAGESLEITVDVAEWE